MKLSEMLTYTASEYLDDRTDLVDGDADSLWSDSFLVRQFNEAQRLLARRSWCIIEYGVAPAGVIVLRTGVSLYSLNAAVLRVFDATPSTQTAPLGRSEDTNLRDTSLSSTFPNDIFTAFEVGEAASLAGGSAELSGAPIAMATDAGTRVMRIFPPPTSAQNGVVVSLKVARLPVKWLALEDTEAEPEVPEDYHYLLCTFAAGKALTQPNVDGEQKADGRALLKEFYDACREARQDRQRAEMSPSRWAFSSTTALLGR